MRASGCGGSQLPSAVCVRYVDGRQVSARPHPRDPAGQMAVQDRSRVQVRGPRSQLVPRPYTPRWVGRPDRCRVHQDQPLLEQHPGVLPRASLHVRWRRPGRRQGGAAAPDHVGRITAATMLPRPVECRDDGITLHGGRAARQQGALDHPRLPLPRSRRRTSEVSSVRGNSRCKFLVQRCAGQELPRSRAFRTAPTSLLCVATSAGSRTPPAGSRPRPSPRVSSPESTNPHGVRHCIASPAQQFQAVHPRHRDVRQHQGDVRALAQDLLGGDLHRLLPGPDAGRGFRVSFTIRRATGSSSTTSATGGTESRFITSSSSWSAVQRRILRAAGHDSKEV